MARGDKTDIHTSTEVLVPNRSAGESSTRNSDNLMYGQLNISNAGCMST